MLRKSIVCVIVLCVLSGCTSREDKKTLNEDEAQKVELAYKNAIKETILTTINDPKAYQEISWKKMQSSEKASTRISKKVVFIAHTFKAKNIYGGSITKENIYFIGDATPSLIIDFEMKNVFEEFLSSKSMRELFSHTSWNFETLQAQYQKRLSDPVAKEGVKDFIYSISKYSKEDQDFLMNSISNANNPMFIAKNMAIFLNMRSFPELMEELLFNEITYNGKYK